MSCSEAFTDARQATIGSQNMQTGLLNMRGENKMKKSFYSLSAYALTMTASNAAYAQTRSIIHHLKIWWDSL